jgi:hypothetical protein
LRCSELDPPGPCTLEIEIKIAHPPRNPGLDHIVHCYAVDLLVFSGLFLRESSTLLGPGPPGAHFGLRGMLTTDTRNRWRGFVDQSIENSFYRCPDKSLSLACKNGVHDHLPSSPHAHVSQQRYSLPVGCCSSSKLVVALAGCIIRCGQITSREQRS